MVIKLLFMKIVLLGFMGSGKSTVGRFLAQFLGIEFADLDDYISEREKMNISEIFKHHGENYFRIQENKHLRILLKKKNIVIASGGGTPCFFNNMELIGKVSFSIYLKSDTHEILSRLYESGNKDSRPLLKNIRANNLKEFISSSILEREKFYLKANLILNAKGKIPEEIAMEIVSKIK